MTPNFGWFLVYISTIRNNMYIFALQCCTYVIIIVAVQYNIWEEPAEQHIDTVGWYHNRPQFAVGKKSVCKFCEINPVISHSILYFVNPVSVMKVFGTSLEIFRLNIYSIILYSTVQILFTGEYVTLDTKHWETKSLAFQSWKYSLPARRSYKQDTITFMGEFFNHEHIHCQPGEVTSKTISFSWVNFSIMKIFIAS